MQNSNLQKREKPLEERPVLGLHIQSSSESEAVATAILRAQQHGYDVIAVAFDNDTEAYEFAEQLDVTIIDALGTDAQNPRKIATRAAKERNFSKLIWQDDPGISLDYEMVNNFLESDASFVVDVQQLFEGNLGGTVNRYTSATTKTTGKSKESAQSIAAIVPAYNERETVTDVIRDTSPYVDSVFVIDDASADGTKEVAAEYADGILSHPENMGVGAAVYTGYQAAIQEDFDLVVQVDADGQHDPSHIPEMLQTMEEEDADMVIGSRWLNSSYKEYSLTRRAGVQFFTKEVNLLGGTDVTDVTSGYRVYTTELLDDLGRPANSHWALEQTLEAARKDYSITEVSIPMPPAPETSQFDLKTFLLYPPRMLATTLKVLLFR